MTVRAFVLIEAEAGRGSDIVDALRQIPQMVAADRVTGPYDVICVLELDELHDLGDLVVDRVHKIDGIARTMSCVGYSWSGD